MNEKSNRGRLAYYFGFFKEEFVSWQSGMAQFLLIFILFVTFTSLLQEWFDFQLLPVFENTLAGFRDFANFLFDKLIYSWLNVCLKYLCYFILIILEPLLNIKPYLPNVEFPESFKELAIISLVLLRSQKRAMQKTMPTTTLEMDEHERSEYESVVKNSVLGRIVAFFWFFVLAIYWVVKKVQLPLKKLPTQTPYYLVGLYLGGAMLLGIFYLLHDLFLLLANRNTTSTYATDQRIFMIRVSLTLFSGFCTSIIFLLINGYFIG